MADLTSEIKALAKAQGAHLVGVAPVDRFDGAPEGHHPADLLRGVKSVVVVAHRFFQGVGNRLARPQNNVGTSPIASGLPPVPAAGRPFFAEMNANRAKQFSVWAPGRGAACLSGEDPDYQQGHTDSTVWSTGSTEWSKLFLTAPFRASLPSEDVFYKRFQLNRLSLHPGWFFPICRKLECQLLYRQPENLVSPFQGHYLKVYIFRTPIGDQAFKNNDLHKSGSSDFLARIQTE